MRTTTSPSGPSGLCTHAQDCPPEGPEATPGPLATQLTPRPLTCTFAPAGAARGPWRGPEGAPRGEGESRSRAKIAGGPPGLTRQTHAQNGDRPVGPPRPPFAMVNPQVRGGAGPFGVARRPPWTPDRAGLQCP